MLNIVVRKEGRIIDVILMKHKDIEQYSFVNMTKGHICPCRFNSVDEALRHMIDNGVDFTVIG